MSITICINEIDTAKKDILPKIEHDAHGNSALLKALYEETAVTPQVLERTIQGELTVDRISEIDQESSFIDSVAKAKKKIKAVRALPTLVESLRFEDHGHVDIGSDHAAVYYINFFLDKDLIPKTSFVVRWGSYDDVPENWEDLEVESNEINSIKEGHYYIKKTFPLLRRGWYGATCFAVDKREGKVVWQGSGFAQDARFRINQDHPDLGQKLCQLRETHFWDATGTLTQQINNYEKFEQTVFDLYSNGSRRDVARILFEATKDSDALRDKVFNLYQEASSRAANAESPEKCEKANILKTALNNLGIGEVVLIAPEGPQATFGGLAQVMEGFLKTFPRCGIPVTLISLLYEQAQGNKHTDALNTLRRGLYIDGQHYKLKYAGEVDIPFGPTHRANTQHNVQQSHIVRANVYMAEKDGVRIVLLRHNRFSDRLYPRLMGDEHLRRAIFLGRGALEVMKNPSFGIKPQLILSNDWVSALVPVFLKLDQRYSENDNLRGAKTIHLIHNCGRDYHGRFPNHHDGQNLFPLLELNPVHYEGLMDPHAKNFFNMTAAAVHHLNGAVLAVSRPYAQQLLTREGGEGLDHLMWRQREAVFGISNGVDQLHLRKTVSKIGEGAREDIGWGRTKEDPTDLTNYFDKLLSYKEAAKLRLQKNFGLQQDANKIIISLVGRLAEQKGIQILMGNGAGDSCSVLELILRRYGDAQIVIAGPRVDGDDLSGRFCAMVDHLKRCFPGRIVGIFDFVPHDFAMEVFAASDFALMPSRFEPGGLTQLEALAAGSLVIARNVGGISATLQRFDNTSGHGNGFMFDEYSSTAVRNTICWAIDRTRDKVFRQELMLEAAKAEHDWMHRMPQYLSVFQHINGVLAECNQYKFLKERAEMLGFVRA